MLVLYSTYLTRSGDLQDTSVHAFTGEGITVWHLRGLLFIFLIPAFVLFFNRYKKIPFIAKEEETSSREFWMFVGSLVIFLAALLIIIMTSIPVINKLIALFSSNDKVITPLAVGEDSAYAYNRIQVFVATILGIFTGFGMYLKYKKTGKPFLNKLWLPVIVSLVIGGIILAFGDVNYRDKGYGFMAAVWIAVIAAVYSVIANGSYIFTGIKGNMKKAGGAISHFGFALMLLGILISSSKKEILSYNTSGIAVPFGSESKEKPGENLTLVKGLKTDMGKYWVTYASESQDDRHPEKWFYHLKFERKDGKDSFTLSPNAYVNPKGNMGLSANPDAKHYFSHDIFTYITSLPDPNKKEDTSTFRPKTLSVGDTAFYSKGFIIVQDVEAVHNTPMVAFGKSDSAVVAKLKVMAKNSSIYTIQPVLINKGGVAYMQPDTLIQENLVLQLQKSEGGKIELGVKETDSLLEYVTLKAYKFPFINILWLGTIVMVIGFMISMVNRMRSKKQMQQNPGPRTPV